MSGVGLTGDLVLDAGGNPNAVWVFQIPEALTTASSSRVLLTNGASACNVYWQIGSSATLGTNSTFVGTLMALTSISVNTGTNIQGRALARNGAVTLDNNRIFPGTCSTTTSGTTSGTTTGTTVGVIGGGLLGGPLITGGAGNTTGNTAGNIGGNNVTTGNTSGNTAGNTTGGHGGKPGKPGHGHGDGHGGKPGGPGHGHDGHGDGHGGKPDHGYGMGPDEFAGGYGYGDAPETAEHEGGKD